MSEEKTVYVAAIRDLLSCDENPRNVANDLDDGVDDEAALDDSTSHEDYMRWKATADAVRAARALLGGTAQPREVEYEWAVLEDSHSLVSESFETEESARDELVLWLIDGHQSAYVARRPVGEWERVDG
jgi:hypothetical protein